MTKNNIFLTFVLAFLLTNCASFEAQYKSEDKTVVALPNKPIDKTFYLVGDAGKSPMGGFSSGLTAYKNLIKQKDTKGDYTIFLGDNIYPAGLPTKEDPYYDEAKNHLQAQVNAVSGFNGEVLFIPGNHDWYADGLNGLKDEEKFIEDALGKNTFQPENGCPLEVVEVSDGIELIIIDTQWYLENWNDHPTINDECEIKTRERFLLELEGEFKKAQNKTVVVAMHHPMYTNGTHGGFYSADKHLYPTQSKIPVPILASFLTQVRTQGGVSIQDRYNERYNKMMNRIETLALEYTNIIFTSGHEHNLQYIENNGIKQIVSGSGAKQSGAALSNNGLFAYGKQGFATLTVYKDGSSYVSFYGEDNEQPKLLYTKQIAEKNASQFDLSTLPDSFLPTIQASIYTEEETKKTGVYKTFFGEKYRDIYSQKVEVPVATLDTLYGGLEIVREGGGHQTRSLRLQTKDGRQLNMRALRKSATQYLQTVLFKETYLKDDFDKTKIEDLILDFYTAAHPYAFSVVPDLSHAAGVYHTNPKLFYIPKHKYLKDYNYNYGGELYLIEERPEDNYTDEKNFGYADDIESTHDIIKKIRTDEKYKIDENAFVRARLFDMLLGDWDRHQDQWRWAQFNQDNGDKLYKPIPRDRDQVFSNFDGALLDIMRFISGSTKQLQVYDGELKDIKWMNSAGIKLDKVLIQNSDKSVWIKQAQYLQDNITDAVIEEAFSKVPKEVQEESLLQIKTFLKERKNNLLDIAERYSDYLNQLVILTGTDKDDYIEVNRIADNKTQVVISRIKDGKKADVIVDRTFDKDITKELWIYALDDDDIIEVSGKASNLIFTRIIGGQNNDEYIINNGRRVRIYDHKSKPNTITKNNGAKVKFTDIYNNNLFDFQKNIVKTSVVTPSLGYNPDDGFKVGVGLNYTVKGFSRNPYSQQHRFKSGYFFATSGFSLNYDGEFANLFGEWNLHVAGQLTSENFTNNFFGYGNETVNNDDDLDLDYNRIKTSIYAASVGVLKKGDFGSDYGIKITTEAVEIGETPDRFIETQEPSVNTTDFYNRRFFAGLEGNFNYHSFDNAINPSRGMTFDLGVGGKTEVKDSKYTYGFVNTALGFYNALSTNRKLVLKTDARAQMRFGDDLIFYQAANIGGANGLRGYRLQRFTGQNSLTGSADIRYSFNQFKTKTLPLQLGVFVGGDVGRVWTKNDASKIWHNDYGVGFWVTAADSVSGTFNFFNSEEGLRFSFGFGLNF
ncbi:metallophosphoesterase [Olleya sp. UBA1516]|uniref:metallophosphoesterase n=1 Tax=Olleya sp. UBA1516 TaxID=1947013 RepID=UPI0025ED6F27|nr:metallophosphoesterase [Olleya sp. UBA1516]|tara:strand:+ start:304417 stop:308127 length:3711 start_codon:yes stop_codon:yes gene_type:complete